MKNKLAVIGLLVFGLSFSLTGCGEIKEEPAAGVSIANAEGQTLGFTYLYDLGNGYKLYADNFTKIVYLRYDYEGGKGATSIGSASMTPYISPNGYYYKVNTQTRVIEEYIPNQTTVKDTEDTEEASSSEESNSTSQREDIEAILNENGQKNQNSNNQQKQEAEQAIQNQDTEAMPEENNNTEQSVEEEQATEE